MTGQLGRTRWIGWVLSLALIGAIGLLAIDAGAARASGDRGKRAPVRLQLQWSEQSQFAGYLAAAALGYYAHEGLDLTIIPGGFDIVPQDAVTERRAEFAVAWVPKALVSREAGAPLVNVAQIFQRSGTREVSWRDSGITRPADWAGRRVGTWGHGNELELFAAMRQVGLDPDRDVDIVLQPFDMNQLLNREIDAAQAMIYNEYALVLETINPETGRLYQPGDLAVIDFNEVGTAMLQDALWAREDWLADPRNAETTRRFLRASFRGWVDCRDNFDACIDLVLRAGPSLPRGHSRWQLNEVNKLIWPDAGGLGQLDRPAWEQTVRVATTHGVLAAPPDPGAYRTDLAAAALADLAAEGIDVWGLDYQPRPIEIRPGGE